jgi:carbonic anhydrase
MKRSPLFYSTLLLVLTSACVAQQAAPAPAHHPAAATQKAASPDAIWSNLMAGNARYVAGHPKTLAIVPLRQSLTKDQHPKVAVLTCSDSRVPPEMIFDQSLGDLFVVRSAGNIADAIGLGSLEYAVEHLGSTMVLVMGHTGCGAVKAACSGDKMPTPNLQAIVDQINPAVTLAKTQAQGDAVLDAAVRDNVDQSAKDLLAHSDVLHHMVDEGKINLVKAVYHLDTGKVERLGN